MNDKKTKKIKQGGFDTFAKKIQNKFYNQNKKYLTNKIQMF